MSSESTEPAEPATGGKQTQGGIVRPDPFVRGLKSGGEGVTGGQDEPDPFVRGLASDDPDQASGTD